MLSREEIACRRACLSAYVVPSSLVPLCLSMSQMAIVLLSSIPPSRMVLSSMLSLLRSCCRSSMSSGVGLCFFSGSLCLL